MIIKQKQEIIFICIAIDYFQGKGKGLNSIATAALAVYHFVQQAVALEQAPR